jgi:predicted dehydrogenase
MSFDVAWSRRRWLRSVGAAVCSSALAEAVSACTRTAAERGSGSATNAARTGEGLASSPGPSAVPQTQRVGFAVVGLGKLALSEILPAFASCKQSRVTALVSGDRAKAENVAKQYGIDVGHIYSYEQFDRLRDDASVDVVYVVLPNGMHAEYTVRAAQAGKHVLCEKPMANTAEDCRAMIAACSAAHRQLMIAYRMQYEPFNREAIRMARAGELGKLKNFVSSNGQMQKDPTAWRLKRALAGGGPLPDVGIYCLNAARYLSGEEPIEVSALLQAIPDDPRFHEVEAQVDFSLRFPSGLLASCACSYDTHDSKQYRLLGDDAWLELDPAFPYRGQRMRIARRAGNDDTQIIERDIVAQNQFALELDHMATCVRENRRPHTPGEEGLQDVQIIAAIYESARRGQAVKLPAQQGLDIFRGPAPA